MIEDEIRTDTEQPLTRRGVVGLAAALLATSVGLASLTGVAARESEPGDDRGSGGGGQDDPPGDDRGSGGGGQDDPPGDDNGGQNGGQDDNRRRRRRGRR